MESPKKRKERQNGLSVYYLSHKNPILKFQKLTTPRILFLHVKHPFSKLFLKTLNKKFQIPLPVSHIVAEQPSTNNQTFVSSPKE